MDASYLQLPFETAWRASIVPFSSEAGFYAMLGFGGYNMWLAMALAVAGAAIGHSFNWLGGQIFLHYYRLGGFKVSPVWYKRIESIFYAYGVYFLLLCWAPFINGMGFLAGFFNLRYKHFLPLVIMAEIGHYSYYILK